MGKLVVLKITDGSFEQGFSVTLQIGEENARHAIETVGRLPAAPELPQYYDRWQSTYYQLGQQVRLTATKVQKPDPARMEECRKAAQELQTQLNTWLRSETYRPIREKWLERLTPDEEIRVILQTEDPQLRRLPWHLLDFLERYPKAEIALSALKWEMHEQPKPANPQVKILAILGDSTGIDTKADQSLLERLPQADPTFLPEPSRKEITDQLWQQPWDILFFAGHSASQGSTGRIFLNQTDSLTISDLKNGLRKAIQQGLKFAIFNSCDGLGLVPELADLQIPQMVVMREPVPDLVAQEFLKYFLEGFAHGKPFYLAVREARERLQGLEDWFPCASWLPVICQHPAVIPPTWQELIESKPILPPPVPVSPSAWLTKRGLAIALLCSLAATTVVSGLRFLGWLQPSELKAFDHMLQQRRRLRDEGPDKRLLVVAIDKDDIAKMRREESLKEGISLSDQSLYKLLGILEQYQPRAIGLDLYRDFKPDPAYEDVTGHLKNTQNLIGVCKVSVTKLDLGIGPPIGAPGDRVGFSDFADDDVDGVLRRHLLFMNPPSASSCQATHAFSMELSYRYLLPEGIHPSFTADGNLQLGTLVMHRLQSRTAGYQGIDANGGQVLLNYRDTKDIAEQVKLTDLLSGRLNSNVLREAIQNRIVLIGVTSELSEDRWVTPYSAQSEQKMPGVLVQAQMISQVLSAALDGRPLLWSCSPALDVIWIGSWSLFGGAIAWQISSRQKTVIRLFIQTALAVGGTSVVLYICCIGLLVQGGWVPFVPPVLALVSTSGITVCLITAQLNRRLALVHSG